MDSEVSRRQFLRRGIITPVAAGSLLPTITAQETGADSWREFGNGPTNSAYAPGSEVSGYDVSQRWTLNTTNPVNSSISVFQGTVYFTDMSGRTYRVTEEGSTSVFDIGAVQADDFSDAPTSTPALGSERMYFGGLSEEIISVDRTTGSEQWTVDTDAEVRSSPVLSNGGIYISDSAGNVYKVGTDGGEVEWTYETGGTVYSSAVISQDYVYVLTQGGGVHRVETSTGEGGVVTELDDTVEASPVSDGNTVYAVTTGGDITALTDEVDWEASVDASVSGTPALADEVLYLGTSDGRLIAVDTSDGESLWSVDTDGGLQSGVSVAGETVIAGTDNGSVYGIDTVEKEVIWRYSSGTEVTTPVSVANDSMYFGGANGQVFSIEAETGFTNQIVDSLTSGDLKGAYGAIDSRVPRVAQIAAGVGVIGLLAYISARKLTGGKTEPERNPEGSSPPSPESSGSGSSSYNPSASSFSLSGDAAPVSEKSLVENPIDISFSDASYGDFEQIEKVGSGGNADVYKARHRDSGTEVALKVPRIPDKETVDTSTFSEFLNEAEVWSSIDDHSRIVSVYDWGDKPLPWIAVEYMNRGTLGVQNLNRENIYVELEGLCEGLYHAHRQGVTHTDIKPENILYKRVNGKSLGKLTDWGLANELLEHSNSVAGFTPEYSAPEQLRPEEYGGTDEQTDMYQLGVVAYELFTGDLPYEADSHGESVMAVLDDEPKKPSKVNPGLDEGLDEVLLKVLSKEKEHRYETTLHFRDDLRRVYDQNRR